MTRTDQMAIYLSLVGVAVLCAVVVYLIYRRRANWKRTVPSTRIKISGTPLDTRANIKLLHQQPRLGGSLTMVTELNPLMRHALFRDAGQAHRVRCNTSTGQQVVTSASRKNFVRPLSQSAQYLTLPSSTTSVDESMTPIGSCDSNPVNDCPPPPQMGLTLVYVSASAQLLVHIHRISNAISNSRYAKEFGTRIKVVLDGRLGRSYRSALVSKSLHLKQSAQAIKLCDVASQDLVDGDLITSVYLRRGRWRNDKKLGSWRLHLSDKGLTDGVPRSFTGSLNQTDNQRKDAEAEPCRQMRSVLEMGQLLVSLGRSEMTETAPGRLDIVIRRAQGLPHTKSLFEPDYIVVVNAHYPDGITETKETFAARGRAPVWNQTIHFDVNNHPIVSCWLHVVVLRKSKKGHGPSATVGHLTLGLNSTPNGERHWQAVVDSHDKVITQWHHLTSR